MKIVLLLSSFFFVLSADAQIKPEADSTLAMQTLSASCGKCLFKLPAKECELAVRVGNRVYYVEGTTIDDHGDSHANDGFCNMIRQASVQGKVEKNKFHATYFKLLPLE